MIEINHLTKKYGDHTAVSDLTCTIEKGRIYGFLGPNGAGKSTTMNIMTGCLAATSGEVKIGGYDIFEEPKQAKKLIGYLPEIPPLYVEQTPREYLGFVARAKGVKGKAAINAEIDRVVEETHIEDVENKLIRHLSKGYRQRVGIAQALIGNPEVIILDEPTVGLDPMQIIEIRDLIKELGKSHTVILSSHILSEVQAICEMVLIISKGKLIAFDKPENLEGTLTKGGARIDMVILTGAEAAKEIITGIDAVMNGDTKVTDITVKSDAENRCELTLAVSGDDLEALCRELAIGLAGAGAAVIQMNPVKASLEDIFIELTQSTSEEEAAEEAAETAETAEIAEAEETADADSEEKEEE